MLRFNYLKEVNMKNLNKKISWKLTGIFQADVNKCYSEINKIEEITPEKLVEFAKDKTVELHKCFEWDNNKAAHEFRKQQARNLINNFSIEYEIPEKNKIITVGYEIVLNEDGQRYYIEPLEAMNNKSQREYLFQGIKRMLVEAQEKLETYNELLN
jgi:hypothetical protein